MDGVCPICVSAVISQNEQLRTGIPTNVESLTNVSVLTQSDTHTYIVDATASACQQQHSSVVRFLDIECVKHLLQPHSNKS